MPDHDIPHCPPSCRYEDNFDPVTNLTVMVMKTDKSSVTGWGSPQKFLDQHRYLLGEQVFVGGCTRVSLRLTVQDAWKHPACGQDAVGIQRAHPR
jgi:hypothetical protein